VNFTPDGWLEKFLFIGAYANGNGSQSIMAFHFKRKEPAAKAIRRLCRERIARALASLKQGDLLDAIHDVRREIKRLRALLRLARGEISDSTRRKFTKPLRRAAQCLAVPRDAHVTLTTVEELARRFNRNSSRNPVSGIKKDARENCRTEIRRFRKGTTIVSLGRILKKLKRGVKSLKVRSDGWPALEPGLRMSYGHGRKAYQNVLRNPSPENFHEWRKRVKDLWHQLQLLRPAWPEAILPMTVELETLSDCLGDDHDLVLLKQFIRCVSRKQAGEMKILNSWIDLREKELHPAALKLGARLYAESPVVFCRRLEAHWNIWRGGHVQVISAIPAASASVPQRACPSRAPDRR
jgi:CHAD domain-containing protein